ncbi:HAMP domain-containing sensor histidine kinase [Paenibacillus arenosi]|uniref:Oxygen sensor histidine kinase NreB n=1 Tax=Paenibacillus arenosi TaxID=2774142 RepID=A0ABR9B089_9BACL|nr:sensor histidine kinase [Paenibacillus arenosi]MBD8499816.1 sensor histidine kinase [Paenibacillus arenosi]
MGYIRLWRANNLKWELLCSFIISGSIIVASLWLAFSFGDGWFTGWVQWLFGILTVLIVSLITGYVTGLRIQRKLDTLNESMMQVAKGNWSVRIQESEHTSFDALYEHFNTMMQTTEQKLKLLQKLTEQQVIEREIFNEQIVQEERKRLARDLHDSVSQQLFAIHMSSASLPKVMELDEERAKLVVTQLIEMSHNAQRQMRALISQLRPIELDGRSLQEALGVWFPDYCRQNGLQGKIDIHIENDLSEAKEHQCFLMIQEAMANVVKHAKADQVTLSMQESANRMLLSIADDGVGFDRNNKSSFAGSYGLTTMQERADKLGGHMELISQPGAGTTIRVYIPLFEAEGMNQDEQDESLSCR